MQDNLLTLQIVENKTWQTIILEHYTDSSLAINQGLYQSFYINGFKKSEGVYENNKEQGLWKKWNDKGKLIDSTFYYSGKKLTGTTFYYYENGQPSFYDFKDIENNIQHTVTYDDEGIITNTTSYMGDKGIFKYYNNKKLVQIDTVFSKVEIEPSYPGGKAEWTKYVQNKIIQNDPMIKRDNRFGKCRIRFVVNKEGYIKNAVAITMVGSLLAEVAIEAIKKSKQWTPATQCGKPVDAYIEQYFTMILLPK